MLSMSSTKVTKEAVLEVLAEYGRDKFYIEYDGFHSEHLAHTTIAMLHVGDSLEHFRKFVDYYVERLEPPNGPTARNMNQIDEVSESVEELLGQRRGFYKILAHYRVMFNEIYKGSIEDMVKSEFPKLSAGLQGSLFHPLINTGYAVSFGACPDLVVESLAYMHHLYNPVQLDKVWDLSTFGRGNLDLMDVFTELRQNDKLFNYMEEKKPEKIKTLMSGGAEFPANALACFDKGDVLMEYAHRVKLPHMDDAELLMKWLVDQTIIVYAGCENKNDFFLLHCVTSAWALKQVIPLLAAADQMSAVRTFLCSLFAAFVCQGRPEIKDELIWKTPNVDAVSWDGLRERLLGMEMEEFDEHFLKLFQVCHDQWGQTGDDAKKMEAVYKRAILNNLDNTFFYYKNPPKKNPWN